MMSSGACLLRSISIMSVISRHIHVDKELLMLPKGKKMKAIKIA